MRNTSHQRTRGHAAHAMHASRPAHAGASVPVFDSLHALGRAIREVRSSPQAVPAHLRPLKRHLERVVYV